MNDEFKAFGRKSKTTKSNISDKAVFFTRVSSKEQTEGFSLSIQENECLSCAKRFNLDIIETFGGSHESAKNVDGAEYQRMLKFVKNPNNKVGYVIVKDLDRFSRAGISTKEELGKLGIIILESNSSKKLLKYHTHMMYLSRLL